MGDNRLAVTRTLCEPITMLLKVEGVNAEVNAAQGSSFTPAAQADGGVLCRPSAQRNTTCGVSTAASGYPLRAPSGPERPPSFAQPTTSSPAPPGGGRSGPLCISHSPFLERK